MELDGNLQDFTEVPMFSVTPAFVCFSLSSLRSHSKLNAQTMQTEDTTVSLGEEAQRLIEPKTYVVPTHALISAV